MAIYKILASPGRQFLVLAFALVCCLCLQACSQTPSDVATPEGAQPADIASLRSAAAQVSQEIESISQQYDTMSKAQKREVVDILVESGTRGDNSVTFLSRMATDPAVGRRVEAVIAAEKLGLPQWRDWLDAGLADDDGAVRARFVSILSSVSGTSALDELATRLSTDPDSRVRITAAYALSQVANEAVLLPLLKSLKDEKADVVVRIASAGALLSVGAMSAEATDYLTKTLESGTDEEKSAAALTMLGQGGVPVLEAIVSTCERVPELRPFLDVWMHRTATDLFEEDAIGPYLSADKRLTVDALARWLFDNEGRVRWDSQARKYVVAEQAQEHVVTEPDNAALQTE